MQKFRASEVDSMADVVQAVESSCKGNLAERYSWTWYAWDEHLDKMFTPIPRITTFQHFKFARESPGVVCMKKHCQADEVEIRHVRSSTNSAAVAASGLPTTLPPGGISDTRLLYLNKEIKQYLGQD